MPPTEVSSETLGQETGTGASPDGARATALGSDGGPGRRARRHRGRRAAMGISYSTIQRGLKELAARGRLTPGRIRRPGGGRKTTLAKDPTLLADLEGLVEPTAAGDPMSPLRWTSKSVRHLATALERLGHHVSRQLV